MSHAPTIRRHVPGTLMESLMALGNIPLKLTMLPDAVRNIPSKLTKYSLPSPVGLAIIHCPPVPASPSGSSNSRKSHRISGKFSNFNSLIFQPKFMNFIWIWSSQQGNTILHIWRPKTFKKWSENSSTQPAKIRTLQTLSILTFEPLQN